MMHLAELDQNQILEPAAPVRAQIEDEPLQELAHSIKELGLLQPLIVRAEGEKFEVIAGHRRLLATRIVGLPRVPCLVVDGSSEDDVIAARLHENLYRRDMTAVEEAAVYAELFERLLDVDLVAKVVHRSRTQVEGRLNLLTGDPAVLQALNGEQISFGVAQQLNKVQDDGVRKYLLEFAVREGATVEKVRDWRLQYMNTNLSQINPQISPSTPTTEPGPPIDLPKCYICGSDEDQHDMAVLMIHRSCKRMVERNAGVSESDKESANGRG